MKEERDYTEESEKWDKAFFSAINEIAPNWMMEKAIQEANKVVPGIWDDDIKSWGIE